MSEAKSSSGRVHLDAPHVFRGSIAVVVVRTADSVALDPSAAWTRSLALGALIVQQLRPEISLLDFSALRGILVRPFVPSSLRPFVPSSLRPFVASSLRPFVASSLRRYVASRFRTYILSTVSMPSRCRPSLSVRAVRSQRRRRELRTASGEASITRTPSFLS